MTGGRRRAGAIAAVVAGLAVVAIAFGAPDPDRPSPDADDTSPSGAKGLRLLLEALGADVDVRVGPPPAEAGTALVFVDRLGAVDRDRTLDWVAAGGVLLVADPFSDLASAARDAPCPAALDAVRTVVLDGDEDRERRSGGDTTCFQGLVRSAPHGDGTVVALADTGPLTNELLDEGDNAVLAAALLAPSPGTAVAWLDGPSPEAEAAEDDLFDLVPRSVGESLAQAAVALVLWVLWRGRRLGRPVAEPQPVAVDGSELVVAVGHLLAGRRRPHEAAAVLRADVRRRLQGRFGLDGATPDVELAAAVAARTGIDEADVAAALGGRPVTTDADLLDVAAALDRIRTAALDLGAARE